MQKSDSIKNVMTALGKFQSKALKITKDATNPHFKSKYATLASILDEIQPVLTENNLVFTQVPEESTHLITMLFHTTSGEYIESRYELKASNATPQGIGSAITYARRYSLTALLGLNIDDDDDGNAGSLPEQKNGKQNNQPAQQNGQQQQAAQPAATTPAAPAPAPAQTPFNKKYTDGGAITAVLKSATKLEDVTSLYYANAELVDKNETLRSAFSQRRDAIKNHGKTIITDGQYKQVCDRIRKGDATVIQNAVNVYILNEGQKEELEHLDKQRRLLEEALTIKYNNPDDIINIVRECHTEQQIMKLHAGNAMIMDRDPEVSKVVSGKLRTLKTAA